MMKETPDIDGQSQTHNQIHAWHVTQLVQTKRLPIQYCALAKPVHQLDAHEQDWQIVWKPQLESKKETIKYFRIKVILLHVFAHMTKDYIGCSGWPNRKRKYAGFNCNEKGTKYPKR